MTLQKEMGQLIQAARKKKGLSQFYLAVSVGMGHPQFISNIERGVALLPRKHIPRVAAELDLDAVDLQSRLGEIQKAKMLAALARTGA